jgi:cytochrome c553
LSAALSWAYPVQAPRPSTPGNAPKPAPDITLKRLPDSTLALAKAKINDPFDAPDWYPDDHPPAPEVVLHGNKPLEACAHCHLPNGLGTNLIQAPALAGLPADYIVQQFADFKSGARKSFGMPYGPGQIMPFLARMAGDDDIKAAADYFAAVSPKPWIRVVEAAVIPQTTVSGMMHSVVDGGGTEPIGTRIIEVPEDPARADLRDPRSGFIAYVPPGALKQGEILVTTGGRGKTTACTDCHGADLRGVGPVPPIAGRSPSYIARQIHDIQRGTRAGLWSPLMKPVVAKLEAADIVAIAAYAASREP